MGTGVDHLQRRGSVYRWRRRLPHSLALRPDHCISRSLDTADPDTARRRARACSAYFDVAMMRLMSNGIPPTREELARVLDDVFRRVLDDGERKRAEREEGAPAWVPEPQTDPRYEGVEPEDWDKIPTWPELWASEWQDAVLLNRLSDIEPLVEDALEARDLALPRTGTGWRRFLRLALLAAAGAHRIDAQREGGDYSQGWPMQCGIPAEQVPAFGPELSRPPVTAPLSSIPSPGPETPTSTDTVLFSVSYAEFMASKPVWAKKTRAQAEAVMSRFISLMDDKAVPDITQAVAEKFKQRLREVPALNGKSAYTGLTVRESIVAADRIAEALAAGKFPIRVGSVSLDQDRASGLVQRLSLKTINRDLSFVADWGKWMESADARRTLLHRERNPFAGLLTKKSDVEKESRRSGRKRVGYAEKQVSVLLANLPMDDPADDTARGRHNTRRFWAVMIAFHSGIRLGEISQLRVRDFKREGGVDFIDLTEELGRELKSEAGARRIPVHPALVKAGLLQLVKERRTTGMDFVLPRQATEVDHGAVVNSISKWFTLYRRGLGIDALSTTFHSTRHTFADALRGSALGRDALVDQIMGHEPGGVGAKVYTRGLPLTEKAALVASVCYDRLSDETDMA